METSADHRIFGGPLSLPGMPYGNGRQVRAGIFTTGFSKRVLLTLAPFPAFLTIVGLIYYRFPIPAGGGGRRCSRHQMNPRPLLAAGALLGIGMGGFVDGILFHQILQIHNMLSNVVLRDTVVNVEINMFWTACFTRSPGWRRRSRCCCSGAGQTRRRAAVNGRSLFRIGPAGMGGV